MANSYQWPDGSILTKQGAVQALQDVQLQLLQQLKGVVMNQKEESLWEILEPMLHIAKNKTEAEGCIARAGLAALVELVRALP